MQETVVPITNRPNQRAGGAGNDQAYINVGEDERTLSALGGGMLALYGLTRPPAGLLLTAIGSALIYRGLTGRSLLYRSLGMQSVASKMPEVQPIHVERSITINRSPHEVYRFWRDFENLPRFMEHLESVTVRDDKYSHWVTKAPAGTRVAWDAEIFLEKENELIGWRSLPDAQIANAGTVRFQQAPGGRGCEVKVVMEYKPPAGKLGTLVAKLFGAEPEQQVADGLRRLKQILETGELATTIGQPSGREKEVGR